MLTSDPRVDVVTFGCRLNGVESDAMLTHALAAGHRDLTIVNTCAVTAEATRQARQTIRRLKREHPGRRLVVTGCASETEGAVFRAMAEVDDVLPNASKADAMTWGRGSREPTVNPETRRTRGFVEVQNGCDHRCTFCIIPFGRGASRSIPAETVIARIRDLVEGGASEVVLTGVDVTAYGADLPGTPTLGALVQAILQALPELPRLRLSSLDCFEADPALLDALASDARLMPHLHLSLQAGSDLILKRMKRRHLRRDALAFCRAVRRLRPETAFGADFIVGFPTETEDDFVQTLDLVDEIGLAYIHAFPFSARPGTPAARMPQPSPAVVKDRAGRLRGLAQRRLASHLDGHVGRTLSVLTERGGRARAPDFTPVKMMEGTAAGHILPVTVASHDGAALIAASPEPVAARL